MVTSEWTNLNSKIIVEDTKKKYFKKYFSSVKFLCPGGRCITNPGNDYSILDLINFRIATDRQLNYGGSWSAIGSWRSHKEMLSQYNLEQLESFRNIRNDYKNIKFRVEEPNITLYAVNEQELYDIVLKDLSNWTDRIAVVTRPVNDQAREFLENDNILIKVDRGYNYKIVLKEGNISNKVALYNYLCSLGDNIKVSKTVWASLASTRPWVWGAWFYVNDPDLVTMLNIIEPGVVANIHKLELIPE